MTKQSWFDAFSIWIQQPIVPELELALRGSAVAVVLWFALKWLSAIVPRTTKPARFANSHLKSYRSPNDEMTVRMTGKTLGENKLSANQKVILVIDGNDEGAIPVTIKRRRNASGFDHGLEIAQAVLRAADCQKESISYVQLRPVGFGWKALMFQSFDHPDVNVRLAWLLSLWSFLISTIVGVSISHFHMLFPK